MLYSVDNFDWIWLNFLPDNLLVWLLVLNNINVLNFSSFDWSLWDSLDVFKWLINPFGDGFVNGRWLNPFVIDHSERWLWYIFYPFDWDIWLRNPFSRGNWVWIRLDSIWYFNCIVGWLVFVNNDNWYKFFSPLDNFDWLLRNPVNVFNWNVLDGDNLNWFVLNSGNWNWLLWYPGGYWISLWNVLSSLNEFNWLVYPFGSEVSFFRWPYPIDMFDGYWLLWDPFSVWNSNWRLFNSVLVWYGVSFLWDGNSSLVRGGNPFGSNNLKVWDWLEP